MRVIKMSCRFLLLLTLLVAGVAGASGTDSPRKWNVLFLFADDQRADTIAALGNHVIKTPSLDRLVKSGISFSRAFMQGGFHGATCMPSRAMLLSGRSLFHVDEKLQRDATWPEAFAQAGYRTFVTGKWHNGPASISKVFQQARSVFSGGMANDPLHAPLSDLKDGRLTQPQPSQKHACAVFADEAVRFLQTPGEAPFFCYVAFDAPHDPHIVPEGFPIHYAADDMPLPKNFLPLHPFDNGEMTVRDETLLPWPREPQQIRAMNADYYRYISYLDGEIGRVLDALAASPHAQNTIVVFAADSGVARGSHGLIGKQSVYEHSVRVPLVIQVPGLPGDRRTEAMCYLFDVLPTLGKWCGVTPPRESEGVEFSAVLQDPAQQGRANIFTAYRHVQRAVRNDRWKLIRCPIADRTLLFDLQADPEETKDLSADPARSATLTELTALMEAQRRTFGDAAPLRVDAPRTGAWIPPADKPQNRNRHPQVKPRRVGAANPA